MQFGNTVLTICMAMMMFTMIIASPTAAPTAPPTASLCSPTNVIQLTPEPTLAYSYTQKRTTCNKPYYDWFGPCPIADEATVTRTAVWQFNTTNGGTFRLTTFRKHGDFDISPYEGDTILQVRRVDCCESVFCNDYSDFGYTSEDWAGGVITLLPGAKVYIYVALPGYNDVVTGVPRCGDVVLTVDLEAEPVEPVPCP